MIINDKEVLRKIERQGYRIDDLKSLVGHLVSRLGGYYGMTTTSDIINLKELEDKIDALGAKDNLVWRETTATEGWVKNPARKEGKPCNK